MGPIGVSSRLKVMPREKAKKQNKQNKVATRNSSRVAKRTGRVIEEFASAKVTIDLMSSEAL